MKTRILILLCIICALGIVPIYEWGLSPRIAEAANKFWWGSCRTGGGDCLDGIDGNDLTAGDGALVSMDAGSTTPQVYIYRLYASNADESDPIVIAPDSNPGTLRWHLVNVFGVSFQTPSLDGYNRVDLAINSSRSPASGHAEQYPEGTSTTSRWKMSNQVASSTVEDSILGATTIDTLTNKTIAASDNVVKMTGYIILSHPHRCDGTGAVIQTTATTSYYGQAKYSNSADEAANYCDYWITVPEDIDTTVDLKVERWKFQLGAGDTGTHRYVISMISVANSAAYSGTPANTINLDFAGDASGASGDVESVASVTLTAWKSNVTSGQLWMIRVARDGNATQDASTQDSYGGPLMISYGITQ